QLAFREDTGAASGKPDEAPRLSLEDGRERLEHRCHEHRSERVRLGLTAVERPPPGALVAHRGSERLIVVIALLRLTELPGELGEERRQLQGPARLRDCLHEDLAIAE